MGSTRLPGKVLMPIAGRPLLGHILDRLSGLRHEAGVVVATSDRPADDAVARYCASRGALCFRGSELDVLDRYYRCAEKHGFRHVVRLTADNPFVDVEELDNLLDLHLRTGSDFTHSLTSLPIGVGAEVFTFEALKESWELGRAPHHREHVDEYLLETRKPAVLTTDEPKRRPDVRLTVDTDEDYRRACSIAERSSTPDVTTVEAIALSA